MRAVAVIAFLGGLLLAVRVMFFGVRRVAGDRLHHRRWPLATAAFLVTAGAMSYARTAGGAEVTAVWIAEVVLIGVAAGAGAWWLVKRSAAIPSTDPEDDPRYRFQGHVARVIQAIEPTAGAVQAGRIAFSFDGERHEFDARWSTEAGGFERHDLGVVESEVVIERIEDGVAYVEPWTVVEGRL
jgi:hypothetical protein